MEININGVNITLTTQQLAEIAKQTSKFKTFKDIKSFEDAYNKLGIDIPSFDNLTKDVIGFIKLKIIIEAINDGWKPNWDDANEKKWYPYFDMTGRLSFYVTNYTYDSGYSIVGSRLCLKSKELAEYMGKTFLKEYEDLLK